MPHTKIQKNPIRISISQNLNNPFIDLSQVEELQEYR